MDLPVNEISGELVAGLQSGHRVLLRAPTGSGKSTGVPAMILEAGVVEGMIVVVQPRRMAARMLAEFVARSLEVKLGGVVGYAVRFDTCYSKRSRTACSSAGCAMIPPCGAWGRCSSMSFTSGAWLRIFPWPECSNYRMARAGI